MGLDKKAIETISVNAVRNSIVTSPFLDQFIADNDKEPSWDGNVYIYEDNSKKKNKLKGRLPVQVKGKVFADFSKDEISYSMEVADLKNYLYDGGAVLFVVYLNETGTATKIYYAELTPLKLRVVLGDNKGHKSKSIKLKKFPDDGNKRATIFLNCLQNCQKQASFIDAKLYSLEELEKTGLLEGITIPIVGAGIFDPKTLLLTSETYLYANIKGSSIPQPIELLPGDAFTKEEICNEVRIGDTVFYNKYSIIKSVDRTVIQIGKSFRLTVLEDNIAVCKVNYKNSAKLRTLASDLDFFINYIEHGYCEINNLKIPFDKSGANYDNFNIEEEKNRLVFAKRSVKVLDMLNCQDDLDLTQLSGEDFRNLERLAVALVDKEPVKGIKTGLPPVLLLNVGKLKFALLFRELETEKGAYFVYDFFRSEVNVAYENENGEMIPTSQYAIFHATDLLEVKNIKLNVLFPSFEKVKADDKYTRANWFLLELLEAYDKSGDTRKDLLKVADDFSDWLLDAPEQYLDYHIKQLNRYQVIKRERDLNINEITALWNIVDDSSVADIYKLGAYLLLEQQVPAERYLAKLDEKTQDEFRTYPIFRYYKKAEEK